VQIAQRTDSPDSLDAGDARKHHVHQYRIEAALHDSFRRVLAAADELGLVAEFGKHRIEHDAAERIVLHAQDAKSVGVIRHAIKADLRTFVFRDIGAGKRHRQRERGAAAAARRHLDVAAHCPRQLLDRRQAQSRTAEAGGNADISLRKRAEQAPDLL